MGFFYFVGQSLTVFLRHNLIFVWKLCNNLGMAIFFHFVLKKIDVSSKKIARVKISQNCVPDFWHITVPGPYHWADTLLGLGFWEYYIWVISVSNFSLPNAFLVSILIISPVRLIMSGVLLITSQAYWQWNIKSKMKEIQKRKQKEEIERQKQ